MYKYWCITRTYLTGVVHGISGHQEVTEEEKDFVNIIPHTDIDHGTMYAHVLCVHVHINTVCHIIVGIFG